MESYGEQKGSQGTKSQAVRRRRGGGGEARENTLSRSHCSFGELVRWREGGLISAVGCIPIDLCQSPANL